jgi:hypothetical protein
MRNKKYLILMVAVRLIEEHWGVSKNAVAHCDNERYANQHEVFCKPTSLLYLMSGAFCSPISMSE